MAKLMSGFQKIHLRLFIGKYMLTTLDDLLERIDIYIIQEEHEIILKD